MLLASLSLASLILPFAALSCVSRPVGFAPAPVARNGEPRLKGVWVAAVSSNYPRQKTADGRSLAADCDFIVDQCAALGFNAIFFQVRPSADALYKSNVFPWSAYLTGQEGLAPSGGFDPLAYICQAAHKKKIALHAWINPYRIKAKKGQSLDDLLLTRPALRSIKKFILPSSDGNFYLDPGQPKVRRLIVAGAREIMQGYDVDGLHLDDYFYPQAGIDDSASYKKYGAGDSLEDFRRRSASLLVKELFRMVRQEKPDALFGVSPFGIWANKSPSNPYGSDTRGTQSYSAHAADSISWIQAECLDYIVPQIYWERGHKAADYETLARWWNDALEGSPVRLYIGMADYKAAAALKSGNEKSPWLGSGELNAQLELNKTLKNVAGEVHFNFDSVMEPDIRSLYEKLANNAMEEYN